MISIITPQSDDDCVSNIRGFVEGADRAKVTWDWPRNTRYDLCVVFELQEDAPLEQLLRNGCEKTTHEGGFSAAHAAVIPGRQLRFRIFPARRLKDGGLEIVDQERNNLSARLLRRVTIPYTVSFRKNGLLGMIPGIRGIQTATVRLQTVQGIEEDHICYRLTGGARQDALYGLELARFVKNGMFEVFVDSGEQIALVPDDSQKEYLEFKRMNE